MKEHNQNINVDNTKTVEVQGDLTHGDKTTNDTSVVKTLIKYTAITLIAIALIVGLSGAFGVKDFIFSGLGIEGGNK